MPEGRARLTNMRALAEQQLLADRPEGKLDQEAAVTSCAMRMKRTAREETWHGSFQHPESSCTNP